MSVDRLKGPIRGLARAADPLGRYRGMYRAKLLAQSADLLRVDVEPDDKTVPQMSSVPLRHGIPGLRVSLAPGAYLLVGWGGGRPDDPFAALWSNPSGVGTANAAGETGQGGAVLSIQISSLKVEIGADGITPLLPIDGVLTGQSIDIFTGLPHFSLGNASVHVLAKKV